MKRFVEGQDRSQLFLLPDCLDDYVGEDNPVRIVDAFIDELDLAVLGFAGVIPEATGRPAYHPSTLLKIYLYNYLNRARQPIYPDLNGLAGRYRASAAQLTGFPTG
jgi:transposase